MTYRFEKLGTGFLFTEGPAWHPAQGFLVFSDMPGDHVRRWSATDGITSFRTPSSMANGNTYDRQGRLLTCEHATSQVTRTERDGRVVPIATHHRGKQLNSPNDIVVKRDGGVYFSDPTFGRMQYFGVPREPELEFRGVYRVGSDPSSTELLVDDFGQPNGLCFSLDERRLFINDTERKHIRVFEVTETGALRDGRVWAETAGDQPGAPDGMKIDAEGSVWCCGPGGIHVFDPDGHVREIIEVPEYTANFAWGDEDYRSLFITASTSLYRIRTTIPGRPVF